MHPLSQSHFECAKSCLICKTALSDPVFFVGRVSTGEFWNGMLHELLDLGHTWAFLYFFSYLILAQLIMLNLVVAVLLINYDEQQAADREQAKLAAEDEAANGAASATGSTPSKYVVSGEEGGDKAAADSVSHHLSFCKSSSLWMCV